MREVILIFSNRLFLKDGILIKKNHFQPFCSALFVACTYKCSQYSLFLEYSTLSAFPLLARSQNINYNNKNRVSKTCFLLFSLPPGHYAASHHAMLNLILVADVVVALVAPIKARTEVFFLKSTNMCRYNRFPRRIYVIAVQRPCYIYGIGLLTAHLLTPIQK